MPNWKIHITLTLFLYLIFINLFSLGIKASIAAILLLIFSSLLPDLDHPKSKIRNFVTGLSFLLTFVSLFLVLNYELEAKLVVSLLGSSVVYILFSNLPFKHRGKKSLHQWHLAFFVPLCFAAVFYIIGINYLLAFFVLFGYFVHLLLDRIGLK